VYDDNTSTVRFTRIASPVSPQVYSIAGVPNGSYGAFVLLDMNANGAGRDIGDLLYESNSPFTVSANTTQNFTLSSASASAHVSTGHSSNGTESYSLELEAENGTKHIVSVALVSGLNVAVPFDIGKFQGDFDKSFDLSTTSPTVGDTYVFKVTFSDGTTETLTGSVSAVLDAATNLVALKDGTGGSTPTVPLFTWAAPASPPVASYTYRVQVLGDVNWEIALPSTTLSTLFNSDSTATSPSLTPASTYTWFVSVEDANFNWASTQAAPYVASP